MTLTVPNLTFIVPYMTCNVIYGLKYFVKLIISGSSNSTDCIDCPPGYYCEGTGNVVPDGLCEEGFWCAGAASSARPYDPGNAVSAGGNATYVLPLPLKTYYYFDMFYSIS